MRILISATNLRAQSIGGGDTFVCGLASALAVHTGHEVGLLVSRQAAVRIRAMVDPRVHLALTRGGAGASRVFGDWALLGWRSRRWAADVVVYPHEWKPVVRRPVVLVAQNILWMHPITRRSTGLRGTLLRCLVQATSRSADGWIAVSQETARLWAECGGPSTTAITLLPEGIDLPDVVAARSRSCAMAVTGASAHKGLDMIESVIGLARRVDPEFTMDVVGVARSPQPGRRYHGWVSRDQLLTMMANAKVVVFPSIVESFGLPAFEACALGRPCIVPTDSAMSQWLGDRVATFDGSAEGLSDLLLSTTWQDDEEPDERFLWRNVIGPWIDVIEGTVQGRAKAQ